MASDPLESDNQFLPKTVTLTPTRTLTPTLTAINLTALANA